LSGSHAPLQHGPPADPPRIDSRLTALFALQFLALAGVTALVILQRQAPEIIAFFGLLMLASAALPVWLLLSSRRPAQEGEPPPT
jgi:hypothetical protein